MSADSLNRHLESNGVVQVTTYLKSWLYTKRHAGWFSEGKDGSLYVRQGRGKVCLSVGRKLLVDIRTGRYV